MLKQVLISAVTLMFSMTPALADHHKKADEHEGMLHPAHEMGDAADVDRTEQLSDAYRKDLEKAKNADNMPHPAHKMGSENTHVGMEHPAKEMGEGKQELDERGQ